MSSFSTTSNPQLLGDIDFVRITFPDSPTKMLVQVFQYEGDGGKIWYNTFDFNGDLECFFVYRFPSFKSWPVAS